MKLGVLFSGGKDSCLALQKSKELHEVACLVTLLSESDESYMFHVPNIEIAEKQAEAIGLPQIQRRTSGKKEAELKDLRAALKSAKTDFCLSGIVTGAVRSIHQSTRVQKICRQLDLWCFNPLWLKDDIELLTEVVEGGFEVLISGVFAYPLNEKFLSRKLDGEMVQKLRRLRDRYGLSPAGEGGEIETTVLDAPFFRKRLEIMDSEVSYRDNSGVFKITEARLIDK
jgi:diphthine-ammonia ligase